MSSSTLPSEVSIVSATLPGLVLSDSLLKAQGGQELSKKRLKIETEKRNSFFIIII
jgi:hypothetical protein